MYGFLRKSTMNKIFTILVDVQCGKYGVVQTHDVARALSTVCLGVYNRNCSNQATSFESRDFLIHNIIMPRKRKPVDEAGINWRFSAARDIVLGDLMDEVLPLEDAVIPAQDAWEYYKDLFEFKDVPYSQFERQLEAHREQVDGKFRKSQQQWEAYQRLRSTHPVPTVYENERRIFRHSTAYPLLKGDVYSGRHRTMTPSALRDTRHEYKEWELKEFTQRIYQMERQWKFINHLENERDKKKMEAQMNMEKAVKKTVQQQNQKKAKGS